MENETMKIKLRGLDKAAELNYPTLRLKIKFNESGVAEVPVHIAKKLLSPEYSGYELVSEKAKPTRSSKNEVAAKDSQKEEEFLNQLKV